MRFYIVKNFNTKFCGFHHEIPKGAVCGYDEKGPFIIKSYRLYAEYMGKDGAFWKPIDCKIANYKPTLQVFRPIHYGVNKELANRVDWKMHYENGETVKKVLAVRKKRYNEMCIKYFKPTNTGYIQVVDKNGIRTVERCPKVSDKQAAQVAKSMTLKTKWCRWAL